MDAIMSVERISFGYSADNPVLENVSFSVSRGEILCVIGRNGCGKSTMIDVLTGIRKPFGGDIALKGRPLRDYKTKELAQNVAVVYQEEPAVFPYKVIDVVKLGRSPYVSAFGAPTKQDELIADDALNRLGLSHLRDRTYTEISGGERQMVLIARAIAQQADLVIMDEPTSHLDFRNQAIVMKAAHELATKGDKAVVMTTHSPEQALLYPSTSILLHKGTVLDYGASKDVVSEENLSKVYAMRVKVGQFADSQGSSTLSACAPDVENIWEE